MEIHKFHTYKETHRGLNHWKQKTVMSNKQVNNRTGKYYLYQLLISPSLLYPFHARMALRLTKYWTTYTATTNWPIVNIGLNLNAALHHQQFTTLQTIYWTINAALNCQRRTAPSTISNATLLCHQWVTSSMLH